MVPETRFFRKPDGDDVGFWISAVSFAAMKDAANFDGFSIRADKQKAVVADAQP